MPPRDSQNPSGLEVTVKIQRTSDLPALLFRVRLYERYFPTMGILLPIPKALELTRSTGAA
jgi:hypothetical protein